MSNHQMQRMFKRMLRRGQVGQSIVILAFGMIALLAFVGITTDVAVLFVRYAALRRAVDSASIAAAGQMRQDRSIATVSLAARQMIEFHGINPRDVFVEICQNQPREDRDPLTPGLQLESPADGVQRAALQSAVDAAEIVLADAQQDLQDAIDSGQPQVTIDALTVDVNNAAADLAADQQALEDFENSLQNRDTEVCTEDQRKLVRVTAQIDSPTFFLVFFGFRSVRLEASAVAETAVMDVIIVMDVSESMLQETDINDWGQVGMGRLYVPPRLNRVDRSGFWFSDESEAVNYVFGNIMTVNTNSTPPNSTFPVYVPGIAGVDGYGLPGGDSLIGTSIIEPADFDPARWYNGGALPPVGSPFREQTAVDGTLEAGDYFWWEDWFWQDHLLGVPQATVNARLCFIGSSGSGDLIVNTGDPCPGGNDANAAQNSFYTVTSIVPQSVVAEYGANQVHPRPACRVRFFPYSISTTVPSDLAQIYHTEDSITNERWYNIENYTTPATTDDARWLGFVPTYNFYGCCNDPGSGSVDANGNIIPRSGVNAWTNDTDFSDLVCQPFKQARDATRLFLDRIDFARGDRVGFVTFDRTSYILDPDGANRPLTHMIESLDLAVDTLNTHIGVRAEPNFYVWNENGGGWIDPVSGQTRYSRGVNLDPNHPDGIAVGVAIPINYDEVSDDAIEFNNYPVAGNCPFQNAWLGYPYSLYATRLHRFTGQELGTLSGQQLTDANNLNLEVGRAALLEMMLPDFQNNIPNLPDWLRVAQDYDGSWGLASVTNYYDFVTDAAAAGFEIANLSYEFWSSCRGTNIGASLRAANQALTDPETSRREGAVWVIILLSDGAAGASDPVRGIRRAQQDADSGTPGIQTLFDQETGYIVYDINATPLAGTKLRVPQPYTSRINTWDPTWDRTTSIYTGDAPPTPNPVMPSGLTEGPQRRFGLRGDYGSLGLCPTGIPGVDIDTHNLGELISDDAGDILTFPYCSDQNPISRHFCLPAIRVSAGGDSSVGDPFWHLGFGPGARDRDYNPSLTEAQNFAANNVFDVEVGDYFNEFEGVIVDPPLGCDVLYDVDDYARDWADFVGGVSEEQSGNAVLPTIFTIGFGLTFDEADPSCTANIEECLGEELLRYIADVGDNFQIDNDIQQDFRDDAEIGLLAGRDWQSPLNGSVTQWGPPDPCEADNAPAYRGGGLDFGSAVNINSYVRDGGESCGNYYNAPGAEELQEVFNDIASRLFTRIAG